MSSRKELIRAIGERYRAGSRQEKIAILDEFIALTNYHRKHAIRLLLTPPSEGEYRRQRSRIYDEAVVQVLIVLWEASDRLCGKRLKALIPALLESMERHGHLDVDASVKARLLKMSAASIDRRLRDTRNQIDSKGRRRSGVGSAIRRQIPVRTFADWHDPLPGYFEVDMVEHCGGPKHDGNFVHSLVLTDIATGWTECIALQVRNQLLVIEALAKASDDLPFAILGVDTDNDSAFMNETVFSYCQGLSIEQTRSRAYRKNDQAWVEQKNGSVVRKLVGYGKLSGPDATGLLQQLYNASRLFVNYFQPSFKLKTKTRDGARVYKTYHAPRTPCERLLAIPGVDEKIKKQITEQYVKLDPIALLKEIRATQQALADISQNLPSSENNHQSLADTAGFLQNLSVAWQAGEVRPTHKKAANGKRWWRTRTDPFESDWKMIEDWLITESAITAQEIMRRLRTISPDKYVDERPLRTLQRRVKHWRTERAKELVYGQQTKNAAGEDERTNTENIETPALEIYPAAE